MLRRSLLNTGEWSREELARAAGHAGVSLDRRPEDLSLEEFGQLSNALCDLRETGAGPQAGGTSGG